ncbi:hypothetical protein EC973_005435 [Apophysomyces ossiformis]|uniref:VPS4-associated protein 1 n=1 Tax=Apophysomyces ossiformis TaxID=679940 RepID=A0A8H7BW67_9FUNG|nr:hypothetical protein EC973_005435 [Apophysomyces ossiformis]
MTQTSRLQNLYVARLAAQERPCFVCSKFTSVVLTSADNSNSDWFYICRSHLGDANFCSQFGRPNSPQAKRSTARPQQELSKDQKRESDSMSDLMASIGSAWKSWRGKSETDDKEKKEENGEDKKKEGGEEANKKESEQPKNRSEAEEQRASTEIVESPVVRPQQAPRFILHRDYFYLRQREQLKKIQKKEAAEKLGSIQFPEVPKNRPGH